MIAGHDGDFERHKVPSGDVLWYRDSDHSYWSEIKHQNGKWSGIQKARLASPSGVAKVFDLNLAEKLSGAAAKAGMDWFKRRDKSATRGTNVHEKVLEELAQGNVPSLADVEEDERGFAQGVIAWWADVKPEPIDSEFVVYSYEHGYAGRVDLLAIIDGKRTIVDLKTGYIGISAHGQLAGYELAAEESGYGPIEAKGLLKVTDEGEYMPLIEGLIPAESFASAVAFYREAKNYGRAVDAQWKKALAA